MTKNVVSLSFSVIMLLLANCNLVGPAIETPANPGDTPAQQTNQSLDETPIPSSAPTLVLPLALGTPLPPVSNIISPDNADSIVEIAHWDGITHRMLSVAFSPDGGTLAAASDDQTVTLWDVGSGQELRTLPGVTAAPGDSAALLPDGNTLVTWSPDHIFKLLDLPSGQTLGTFSDHIDSNYNKQGLALSPDHRMLAAGYGLTSVGLWDVVSGEQLRTWNSDWIIDFTFSPDSKMLAVGIDQDVVLIDLASGSEIRTFSGLQANVFTVRFSPDGKILAAGPQASTIKLWDVTSGQELRTLGNSELQGLFELAFSPDGRILASSHGDRTVRLWDLSNGRELRNLGGTTLPAWEMAFSPDGSIFAAASDDGTMRLWGVYP